MKYCPLCGYEIPNEPNESVLRWTRYDGTVGTLPDEGKHVIVKGENFLPWFRWEGYWADCTDSFSRNFEIGDMWAYLQTPEGM